MITEEKALELLEKRFEKYKKEWKDEIINHSIIVRDLSVFLAGRISGRIDIMFLRSACILHDIGYATAKEKVLHGVEGSDYLQSLGLYRYAKAAERHIGVGISSEDAKKAGLPVKDYRPKSIEEKILCYADNLDFFDKKNMRHIIKDSKAVAERFGKELGDEYRKRTEIFNKHMEDKIGPEGMEEFGRYVKEYNKRLASGCKLKL